jgi:hypothetical protein
MATDGLIGMNSNVQNTTKYAQLTNPRRDEEARRLFADHRVV